MRCCNSATAALFVVSISLSGAAVFAVGVGMKNERERLAMVEHDGEAM